ncbi:MAG: SPOR domain-containing protein [Methyloceanibacter sp.]|jgi:tetratricopeptide (TPR) repeat protein|uniref:SPOR domain-containing protein n=1 Tax=Methyloceanibacter sp. TaxID=1965321 RepID=UPI0035640D85
MADHRKSFRPRGPEHDRRFFRRGRMGAALLILGVLAAATPGAAQELGLKHGQKSLDSGNYEMAVRQFSATVNDKDSTAEQAAKALYLRGVALRRGGNPARAIADLGAAVWLGLSGSDKARALVNKGLAYRAVGLSSQAENAIAQARRASGQANEILAQESRMTVASTSSSPIPDVAVGGSVWDRIVPSMPSFGSSSSSSSQTASAPASTPAPQAAEAETRTAEAAPTTGWGAEVADESASQGSSVSRWFGSLTGGNAPAPSSVPAAPTASRTTTAPPTTTASRTTAAPPTAESWAANTSTQKEGEGGTAVGRWFSRQTSSAPSAPAPAQPAAAPRGSGYTVQLANSGSPADAQALWKKAKSSNPQLTAANPRIERVEIGSLGTFYTVKIGPYATSSEGTKVCNALKRRGTDCSVISPDGP